MTRREFMQAGIAAGISSALPEVCAEAVSLPQRKDDNGVFKTRLRAALIARTADPATCERIAAAEFSGVELTAKEISMDTARVFRANAGKAGIRIHSLMGAGWSTFNAKDPNARRSAIDAMKQRLLVANECGASTVLCVPGRIGGMAMPRPSAFKPVFDPKTLELKSVVDGDNAPFADYIAAHNEATKRTLEAVHELIPVAAEAGVALCLENVWNNLWVTPAFMSALVRSFDSAWVKAYLDLGNHVCYAPVETWLRTERGLIAKLHIKDFLSDRTLPHEGKFVPIGRGSIDWKSVRRVIEEIGYSGWVSIESSGFTDAEHRQIMNRFFKGEGA